MAEYGEAFDVLFDVSVSWLYIKMDLYIGIVIHGFVLIWLYGWK